MKERDPRHLTIHGGPDTPKYPRDVERWFRDHPHVDVAVHGEGEATFCELLDALGTRPDGSFDLSGLAEVPGLSFRAAPTAWCRPQPGIASPTSTACPHPC